ncbi:50S ribosomal protein L5 [Candidatus Microgenomates bacterium]|nr:50S ribosomal protein L5 [Candidatus Microgenomates bacterium]
MSLQTTYIESIRPKLKDELGVKSLMAVPRVVKIVVDMGVGDAADSREVLDQAAQALSAITGQKPQTRSARIAIAGFNIRKGSPVGLRVTLRGQKMWNFLEKLITIILPRIRDFRGIKTSAFDGRGNYSLGIEEYSIFPEIDVIKVGKNRGLGMTIVTTAKNDADARRLFESIGMPFSKNE